jgi:trehalose 6-phosphate phosphatase
MERKTLPPPPAARSDWAYFIDFDGTLIEIAPTPGAVRVDDALPALLTAFHRACGGAVAVISGRALADLERRIGLPGIPKAGQHGLERGDAAGGLWMQPNLVPLKSKQAILDALVPILERHPGLLLEDKGMTLALHYRLAPELASFAQRLMRELVARLGVGLVVQDGKCIVEVKPANVDKGTAVAAYLAEPPFLGRRPVFIGDDSTDEYGFAAVNERDGISIGVGPDCINARYTLPDVSAVRAWLAAVQDANA